MSTSREEETVGFDTVDATRYVAVEIDGTVLLYDRDSQGGWVQSTTSVALREVR